MSQNAGLTSPYALNARKKVVLPTLRVTPDVFRPEDNPFQTLLVDVTHRCNMTCRNCYIPNRDVPDLSADWLYSMLERLPRRTRIRLVGAEPTMRRDLPELIAGVRKLGHTPILMTNGLKLADRAYVASLKAAGLRTIYLSLNGGFDDDAYEAIDEMRCATKKRQALDNACAENMYLSLGMILVRGVNEHALGPLFTHVRELRQVYELHIRSIGPFGRYMEQPPFSMEEMGALFRGVSGIDVADLTPRERGDSYADYMIDRLKLQITQWPDLGSKYRGRLAPDGTVQPFFEHMIANMGGY